MTMAWVWTGMVLFSLIFGAFAGNLNAVGAAAMEGASAAVELTLSLAGPLLLWSGLMGVLRRSGATAWLGRRLRRVLCRLFPSAREDETLLGDLTSNITANLLGLGNAATPPGIRAARQLQSRGGEGGELSRLVVLNTASVQFFPATVAAVRSALGAADPLDILPAVWITSALSVTAGLLAERALRR